MEVDKILRLLPSIFQESARANDASSPFLLLLQVMEDMHQPIEDLVFDLPALVTPEKCPHDFLPVLRRFLTTNFDTPLDPFCERELLACYARLHGTSGQEKALEEVLRLTLGHLDISIEEAADTPFHLIVHTPQSLRAQAALVEDVLNRFKPAHLTSEIRFSSPPQLGNTAP